MQPLQLVLSSLQQASSLIPKLLCPLLRSQHTLGLALSQGLHRLVLVAYWALQQLQIETAKSVRWHSEGPASSPTPTSWLCLNPPAQLPGHDPGHCLLFLQR